MCCETMFVKLPMSSPSRRRIFPCWRVVMLYVQKTFMMNSMFVCLSGVFRFRDLSST